MPSDPRRQLCCIFRKTFIRTNRTTLVARQNAVGSSLQPLHEGLGTSPYYYHQGGEVYNRLKKGKMTGNTNHNLSDVRLVFLAGLFMTISC